MADDPCYVFLSSSGLLARTTTLDPPGDGGGRTRHDVIVSAVATTARGEVGVLTSAGRVVKLGVLDLPTLPSTANHPNLQGGAPVGEFLTLEGERVLGLTSFDPDSPGLALGTRQGVVKRVNPEYLSARDDWDVISLKDGDEVVGAVELRTGDETLCFVTSDAQLLHFGAERRAAAGPLRRRHRGHQARRRAPGWSRSRRSTPTASVRGLRLRRRAPRCPAPRPGRSR